MNGRAAGPAKNGTTQNGTAKSTFVIDTDGGELPLRFACVCFGACAERASQIVDGDEIFLTGRMTAGAYSRTRTVVVSAMEILTAKGCPALAEKPGEN
jgi:hypothetical protein